MSRRNREKGIEYERDTIHWISDLHNEPVKTTRNTNHELDAGGVDVDFKDFHFQCKVSNKKQPQFRDLLKKMPGYKFPVVLHKLQHQRKKEDKEFAELAVMPLSVFQELYAAYYRLNAGSYD